MTDDGDDAPCVFFRPSLYFFNPRQPGYEYKQLVEDAVADSSPNNMRWTHMWNKQVSNYNDLVSGGIRGVSPPNEFLLRQGITSVSAIMMAKVGSRSIESLFLDRLSVPNEQHSEKRVSGLSKAPRVGIATPSFWKEIARRQRRDESATTHNIVGRSRRRVKEDIVFCLLRDPIARFLSSLAQTLSNPMQRRCANCASLLSPCVKKHDTYSKLVRCVIDSMKHRHHDGGKHRYHYFDVHVVPQAVFLAASLQQNDVELAVFSMDRGGLQSILQAFGASAEHKNKREEKEFSLEILERFGDELFDSRKAREALDDSMIRSICELYDVDVKMMRHLGLTVKDCD